jgi:hypothetical protein
MKMREVFTDLRPIVWKSKVGRTTFVFPFIKRKVKIYQAANSTHAIFLKKTFNHSDLAGYFHPILFTFDRCLFAEWVEGVTSEQITDQEKYRAIDWIVDLQSALHSRHLCASDEQAGFDYFDYLNKRILQFAPPGIDPDKIMQLGRIASSPPVRKSCLSHPDVTLRNIVFEKGSGKFKIVDNELLTQSPYFLLDTFNTCYSLRTSTELIGYYLNRYASCPIRFSLHPDWASSLAAAWALRIAGSHFQARMFQTGLEFLDH